MRGIFSAFSCKNIVVFHPILELHCRTHQDAIEKSCMAGVWQE
ncbi:MAG: hypothetical protein AB2L18_02485 [Anaerolineaceae bacterium]